MALKSRKTKTKVIKFDKDLLDSITNFEDVHKEYLEEDGTVNDDGYDLLHESEVNWGDDIKWNDYRKYHLQPRLDEYWYNPSEDKEYKKHWIKLHTKKAEEYGVEINE